MGVPSLKQFMQLERPDGLALSKGEVTRFSTQCQGLLGTLSDEERAPTAEDVHRLTARLTWAFFYSRKGAAKEEHERLLAVYLHSLEKLHDVWLDVEKPTFVKERVVREPASHPWRPEPVPTLPRDPEQATISLSPEDV